MGKGKRTWVQDAKKSKVSELISRITERNADYIYRTKSRYETGESRSGKLDEIGVYFFDPTAK